MRIYISNLPFSTIDDELAQLFQKFGSVQSASIIRYQRSMKSKGYGFVQMEEGATDAIQELNGKEFNGRVLTVKEALPRKEMETAEQ